MYVCLCNVVTDHDIRRAVGEGVRSLEQLRARTGCCGGCGCCTPVARDVLSEALAAQMRSLPLAVLPSAFAA